MTTDMEETHKIINRLKWAAVISENRKDVFPDRENGLWRDIETERVIQFKSTKI